MDFENIKKIIKLKGFNTKEVLNKLNISETNFYNWQRRGSIDTDNLEKFAKLLDVPICSFFNEVSGNVINGNGNKNNKQSIINNQCTEIESLKKQIKLLENTIKDKIEIINYLKNK